MHFVQRKVFQTFIKLTCTQRTHFSTISILRVLKTDKNTFYQNSFESIGNEFDMEMLDYLCDPLTHGDSLQYVKELHALYNKKTGTYYKIEHGTPILTTDEFGLEEDVRRKLEQSETNFENEKGKSLIME